MLMNKNSIFGALLVFPSAGLEAVCLYSFSNTASVQDFASHPKLKF